MARLIMSIIGEISLRLDDQELLTDCQPQGRQLLKALLESHHAQIVPFKQLAQEHALTCSVSTALKYLLDTLWPVNTTRQSINAIYTLPYDVSEDEALLCLKKIGKSEILLRLKRGHPDVWVDAWLSRGSNTLPEGTLTFLFTDIEGSTRLWEQYPEAMRPALGRHDAIVRGNIERHNGVIFKTLGDAFCAAFSNAPDGLAAALEAQRALDAERWPSPIQLYVRMALHTGTAELRDGDYFGPPLNRTARLLAIGHGGQVLLSPAATELVRDMLPANASLEDVGRHRLKDLQRAETVFQLRHPDLRSEFPPLMSMDNPDLPNNLPLQITTFIGREQEIAEVKKLLTRTRLLTLAGSGGCGKTRLLLQVAAELLEEYKDGVWLVELAALSDSALVPQAVGNALNIKEEAERPLTQTIATYLKGKRLLLLIDNCEHVIDACIPLIDTLLHSCPGLKMLASSREGLNLGGESLYRVPSLSMPDTKQRQTVETVIQCESAWLFIDRAVAVVPTFRVTEANMAALASVCRRLDGIPLAIELAAARIRVLSVEEIDERLNQCLPLLTGGRQGSLPRHQTLRATLDWSYKLLTEPERTLLARLSVFAGGWVLEAAEAVGKDTPSDRSFSSITPQSSALIVDLLMGLVDKSLVEAAAIGAQTRYRLLETVRQYAAERLEESGETEQARGRHRDYFLMLAEAAEPQLTGAAQQIWLERLEAEHDNLRTALAWCREDPAGAEAGLRLAGALWEFWEVRGYFREAGIHLRQALERKEAQQRTTAKTKALTGLGSLIRLQGNYVSATVLHEEALEIQRELDDRQGTAASLFCLGIVAFHQGDYARARSLYKEALTIQREIGDRGGAADLLSQLGIVAGAQGNYTQACSLHEEALTIQRELGDSLGVAGSLGNLGIVAFHQGDYVRARSLYEEALATNRKLGNRWCIATLVSNLGLVAFNQGDYTLTRALYEEALTILRELGDRKVVAELLAELGIVALHQGDYVQAHSLHEEALTIQREIGARRGIAASLANLGNVALFQGDYTQARALHREALVIRRELEDMKGIAASIEGMASVELAQERIEKAVRLWGAGEVVRKSLDIPLPPHERDRYDRQMIQARSACGDKAFTIAWEEGRAMPLAQAIAYALNGIPT